MTVKHDGVRVLEDARAEAATIVAAARRDAGEIIAMARSDAHRMLDEALAAIESKPAVAEPAPTMDPGDDLPPAAIAPRPWIGECRSPSVEAHDDAELVAWTRSLSQSDDTDLHAAPFRRRRSRRLGVAAFASRASALAVAAVLFVLITR